MATETRKRRPMLRRIIMRATQLLGLCATGLLTWGIVLADVLLWRAAH